MDGSGADLIHGRTATGGGQINFIPGYVGQAIFIRRGGMSIPDGPILDQGAGDFSIDAWIGGPATRANEPLIDKRVSVGGAIRGWSLFLSWDHLGLQLADGGYDSYIDPRTVGSTWRHSAVTVDRDNPQGTRFYIDGQPGPPFNPTNRQGNLDNNAPTLLGFHALNGTGLSALVLDELEFFDRALTPAEVAALFNAGRLGKCKNGL